MEGLRKPQKYVRKEAIPVEACPPLPYHLLFPLFHPLLSLFTFNKLHISLPSLPPVSSFTSHLFLLSPSHRSLWPSCPQSSKECALCAYDTHFCLSYNSGHIFQFSDVSFVFLCFCDCAFLSSWTESLSQHVYSLLPSGTRCVCCVMQTVACIRDRHYDVVTPRFCNKYVS